MSKIETRETITPEIKAISDNIAACGAYSIANPSVPLKDNPHFDQLAERRMLRAAFGTSQVEYRCPCGIMYPQIGNDLRTNCACRSTEVIVVRTVKKA